VVAATSAIYPLKAVAPTVALSVVYLPAVLLVSVYWGLALGLVTSLASAAAFNFFHIPPVGRFTIADARNWVALAAFVTVAAVVSAMANLVRSRTAEAERDRREADLSAALARDLLEGERTRDALATAARSVAQALAISSAAIELGDVSETERRSALPLRHADGRQLATLLVPRDLAEDSMDRLKSRVAPALGALIGVALDRDAIQAEAVETAALRRSDELKTALLRAVSHDLRSPLTAMVTAGHALGGGSLNDAERGELSTAVVKAGERLAALIDNLLDLSRLQAGRAEPHREAVSIEEVLLAVHDRLGDGAERVRIAVDSDVPAVLADAAQLERVFANLLENALRYSSGSPVSVHSRRVDQRVIVRVVDQGPGIRPGEQDRIFEAFYRGPQSGARTGVGSGLGLAIAKGFTEANGGTIAVESLPGQGSSFIVTLPVLETATVVV
jgi:two-component system, OmpR family, sensor histidine kinase KdpD